MGDGGRRWEVGDGGRGWEVGDGGRGWEVGGGGRRVRERRGGRVAGKVGTGVPRGLERVECQRRRGSS